MKPLDNGGVLAAIAVAGVAGIAAWRANAGAGSFGRRYEMSEWVDFLTEPGTPSKALRAEAARFAKAAYARWMAYPGVKLQSPQLSSGGPADTVDNIGYLSYQSIGGAGVGFWDNDDGLVPDEDRDRLNDYMTGDPGLTRLYHRLTESMLACQERGEKRRR